MQKHGAASPDDDCERSAEQSDGEERIDSRTRGGGDGTTGTASA